MQSLLEKPKEHLTGNYLPKMTLYDILTLDPRPDLMDTLLWSRWLKRISTHIHTESDLRALSTLHTLRCIGTVIRWDMNYGYKLNPLYDFGNWDSKELYDEMRQHLMPYAAHFRKWFELIQHEDV